MVFPMAFPFDQIATDGFPKSAPRMSNPEMLRAMVRMNPQLNELMEQRPEIARMLEDPELLQQSLRHAEPRVFFFVGAGMRIKHQLKDV